MAYFRKISKNKQIDSIRKDEKYTQTEITFNELDINILKERIQLLEIENNKLKRENASLRKHSKTLNGLKDKTLVSASPQQNVPFFSGKLRGCTCKGNCANKICGCMKKDLHCSESCKCNPNFCKNKLQEKNKENHGTASHALQNQNEDRRTFNISEVLTVRGKLPTESLSSIDDVFYDAADPDYENMTINLDAVRKLTFNSDEDASEKDAAQLSAIQEKDELNNHSMTQMEEQEGHGKESTNNNGKDQKNRPRSSSSQVGENQAVENPKLTKSSKTSTSNKNSATNTKKQRKGSNSKQISSVEIGTVKGATKELLENPKVNSRSRRNRGSVQSEGEDEKKIKNQNFDKVKAVKSRKDISVSPNLKSIKTAGIASSRESISNLKQPNEWKKLRSSVSVEKTEEVAEKETARNTRSKRNLLKNIVTKVTKEMSHEEISLEGIQSRARGLRRSVSSGAVASETGQTLQKNQTLLNSGSKSKDIQIVAPEARHLNRSLSSDALRKKPLRNFISKVSSSFRKSKSFDIEEKPRNRDQLHESENFNLSPVKESPKNLNEIISKETEEKNLKFDPMQPTRQLSRSPIPASAIAQSPKLYSRNSPPATSRFWNSHDIKIASPSPEILQDLRSEEVDLQTFQSKLVVCRKCKRKFFPHRIQLHEAVCQKM